MSITYIVRKCRTKSPIATVVGDFNKAYLIARNLKLHADSDCHYEVLGTNWFSNNSIRPMIVLWDTKPKTIIPHPLKKVRKPRLPRR